MFGDQNGAGFAQIKDSFMFLASHITGTESQEYHTESTSDYTSDDSESSSVFVDDQDSDDMEEIDHATPMHADFEGFVTRRRAIKTLNTNDSIDSSSSDGYLSHSSGYISESRDDMPTENMYLSENLSQITEETMTKDDIFAYRNLIYLEPCGMWTVEEHASDVNTSDVNTIGVMIHSKFIHLKSIFEIRRIIFSYMPLGPACHHPLLYVNYLRLGKFLGNVDFSIKFQDIACLNQKCLTFIDWQRVKSIDMRGAIAGDGSKKGPYLSDRPGGTVVVLPNESDIVVIIETLCKLTNGRSRFIVTCSQYTALKTGLRDMKIFSSIDIDVSQFFECENYFNKRNGSSYSDIKESFIWLKNSIYGSDPLSGFLCLVADFIQFKVLSCNEVLLIIDCSENKTESVSFSDSIERLKDIISGYAKSLSPIDTGIIFKLRFIDQYGSVSEQAIDITHPLESVPLVDEYQDVPSDKSDQFSGLSNRFTKNDTEKKTNPPPSSQTQPISTSSQTQPISIPSFDIRSKEIDQCCNPNSVLEILVDMYKIYKQNNKK